MVKMSWRSRRGVGQSGGRLSAGPRLRPGSSRGKGSARSASRRSRTCRQFGNGAGASQKVPENTESSHAEVAACRTEPEDADLQRIVAAWPARAAATSNRGPDGTPGTLETALDETAWGGQLKRGVEVSKRHVEAVCADLFGVPISAGHPQQHLPLRSLPDTRHASFFQRKLFVANCLGAKLPPDSYPTGRNPQPALGAGCRVTVG